MQPKIIGVPNAFSYAPMSGFESAGLGRGLPSISSRGISPSNVPAPIHDEKSAR